MNVEKHFEFHSKKNKPQPDKATATHSALPWAQGGNGIECAGRYRVGSVNSIGTREGAANMDLIVKAVNEHAALVAVAEAAKQANLIVAGTISPMQDRGCGDLAEDCRRALRLLQDAMAACICASHLRPEASCNSRRWKVKAEIAAELLVLRTVADTIRELKQVPSGHLYAQLIGHMDLATYEMIIEVLKDAGLVREENHLLTWIEPEQKI